MAGVSAPWEECLRTSRGQNALQRSVTACTPPIPRCCSLLTLWQDLNLLGAMINENPGGGGTRQVQFLVGDKVEFWSTSKSRWLSTTVTEVERRTGSVRLSAKPNVWTVGTWVLHTQCAAKLDVCHLCIAAASHTHMWGSLTMVARVLSCFSSPPNLFCDPFSLFPLQSL